MPGLADDLRALAKRKRARDSFSAIQVQAEELKEHAEAAETALTAVTAVTEAVSELEDALAQADPDNPLISAWAGALPDAIAIIQGALPVTGNDNSVSDLIEELDEACGEYEDCLDNRDYSAADRDELYGQVQDLLEEIAGAIEPARGKQEEA